MKTLKSSPKRLISIFKRSRDKWKARSLEKQNKVRRLEITVRDLSNSRDNWKEKAKFLKQENDKLEQRIKDLENHKKKVNLEI